MPINVFGNSYSLRDNAKKLDTFFFAQRPYLRTNYVESNTEKDIDMKNHIGTKNWPCHVKNSDAVSESYVDSGLNHPSKIQNTAHLDFNDKILDDVHFLLKKSARCPWTSHTKILCR